MRTIAGFGVLACLLVACTPGDRTMVSSFIDPASMSSYGITYFLPRGYISIKITLDATGKLTITQPTTRHYPDFDFRYSVRLSHSSLASDQFVIQTDTNGLLMAVNSTNEDKTVDIVRKLIEIVTEGAKAFTLGTADAPPKIVPFEITADVDPFDAESIERFEAALKKKTESWRPMTAAFLTPYGYYIGNPQIADVKAASELCNYSICFRLLVPIIVEIWESGVVISRTVAVVPDPYRVAGYNVTRARCVKKTTKLSFTAGTLTMIDVDSPSEFLGCLEIPLEVAKAIVSVPSALLDFKIRQINADQEVFDAQRQLVDAQRQLIEAQQKLVEEKAKETMASQ